MKAKFANKIIHGAVMSLVMIFTGQASAALDIANVPLFAANSLDPNIMLLMDSSGSMNNIVPDAPFDPAVTYANCPVASVLANTETIDILINTNGRVRIEQDNGGALTNRFFNWGTANQNGADFLGNDLEERCFDVNLTYDARLYGSGNASGGGNNFARSLNAYAVGSYSGNYLNWYFGSAPTNFAPTLAADGDRPRRKPDTVRRLEIARDAAVELVNTQNNVRFGLATYNGNNGATIRAAVSPIATQRNALVTAIQGINYGGNTPLAESLSEIGRYFIGNSNPDLVLHPGGVTGTEEIEEANDIFEDRANFASGVSNASPIQGFCQQNFAVLLTDGQPSEDDDDISDYLEDYDGDCPNGDDGITCDDDDRKVGQSYASNGGSDYLDDVALALNEMDLRPDLDDLSGNEVINNIVTYVIGFADDAIINDPLVQDTAANGGGLFLPASNASELANAFATAALDISSQVDRSVASVSFNTGSVRSNTQVYQTSFRAGEWSGDLVSFSLHDGGSGVNGCVASDSVGTICPNPIWDAGQNLDNFTAPVSDRTIMTFNPDVDNDPATDDGSGVAFQYAELNLAQKAELNLGNDNLTDGNGLFRLNYLRGDTQFEQIKYTVASPPAAGSPSVAFRDRTSLLGDIVNSAPLFVGAPARRFPENWRDALNNVEAQPEDGGQTYQAFSNANAARVNMVYTGANDGFLHGFESGIATTPGTGRELLAYMPSQALANARELTYPSYSHLFYVDGTPVENDVFYSNAWHTVLVGGLGAGGQGLYALDITNPNAFDEANASSTVLWEFTDSYDDGTFTGQDLGLTLEEPAIARLHNGRWGVVTGNGYANTEADGAVSTTGNAVLYILDVETGGVINKLDTGVGSAQDPTGTNRPNGLATIFPVDLDGDFIVDYVYGGDLFGNVWRFDLLGTDANNWQVAEYGGNSPTPLFTAVDVDGDTQPITTKLQVGLHSQGFDFGAMVYFGTGKYIENGDNTPDTDTIQSFYGIWDKDLFTVTDPSFASLTLNGFTRDNDLQQQQINMESSTAADGTALNNTFRRVTNNAVTYTRTSATQHGWYLDLIESGSAARGELSVTDAVLRGDTVVFTTFIPTDALCTTGGTGFLMVLDQATGGSTVQSPFDVNLDEGFSEDDFVDFGATDPEVASGINITGGSPGFILSSGNDLALIPQFQDGTIEALRLNLGIPVSGRQTWRQLR